MRCKLIHGTVVLVLTPRATDYKLTEDSARLAMIEAAATVREEGVAMRLMLSVVSYCAGSPLLWRRWLFSYVSPSGGINWEINPHIILLCRRSIINTQSLPKKRSAALKSIGGKHGRPRRKARYLATSVVKHSAPEPAAARSAYQVMLSVNGGAIRQSDLESLHIERWVCLSVSFLLSVCS